MSPLHFRTLTALVALTVPLFFFFGCGGGSSAKPTLAGIYRGQGDATGAQLTLETRGQTVTGICHTSGKTLTLEGQIDGLRAEGRVHDPGLDPRIAQRVQPRFSLELVGDQLEVQIQMTYQGRPQILSFSFLKQGGSVELPPESVASEAQGEIDPRLVGTWTNTVSDPYTGSGFVMSSVIRLHFGADGTYWYGNGEAAASTHQTSVYTQNAGVERGHWKVQGDQLYRKSAQTGHRWVLYGRYGVTGARDGLLIKFPNGGQVYWER